MKKIYFSIASCLMLFGGFSQVNGLKNNSQDNQNTTISQAPAKVGQVTIQNSGSHLTSGHSCKSHELTEQYYEEQGMLNQFNQDYMDAATQMRYNTNQTKTSGNTIAVIFHVVHEGESIGTGTNVSNAAIMQVYNDLVEDYSLTNSDQTQARTAAYGFTPANAGINFCLASQDENGNPISETGVVRVSTSKTWFDSDDPTEVNAMKSATFGSQIWDRSKYLNVWICDITNGANSGTAGYAYRPNTGSLPGSGIDGIVLDYNLGVNNDNVLTHEVGHYLGLDHTWGGSGSCSSDDGFADTPNTDGPSFNNPSASCSGNQVNCTGVQTQYENYMDYANCTVMFTAEQCSYMNTILSGIRGSLLLSSGCEPAGPPISAFSSNPSVPIIPVNGTVNYFDESSASPTSWTWTFSGTEGVDWDFINSTTATSENPQLTYYTTGFYDVSLTASNGFGAGTPVTSNSYVQVVAQATGISCDTLRNYDPVTEGGTGYILSFTGYEDWGYLPGHGAYDFGPSGGPADLANINAWAEKYTSVTTAEVRRVRIPVLIADDQSGTGTISVNVHSDGAGVPGAITGTEIVNISDLTPSGAFNEIDFTTPVSVTGDFWISIGLNYSGVGTTVDTVLFAAVDYDDRTANGGGNTLFINIEGAGWNASDLVYGSTSLYMDVLLSNGGAPIAVVDMDIDEVCIGGDIAVDGSGSTNTTDYFWIQAEDPYANAAFAGDNSAISVNFAGPAGDYAVYLIADGSCQSDVVGYVVSVYDVVSATPVPTSTTCNNDNGVITFNSPSGGDGVNYEYSLDGINFQASNIFNNLAAGSYTGYVRTVGNSCETSYSITVGATASPTGTATSNASICPGGSTTLTASGTGATGFDWYAGATSFASGASQTVTPSTTTQYSVVITFASGCTDVQYSNVTVNPLDDASFDFFDFCENGPNSAVNIGEAGGVFSLTVNPDGAFIVGGTGEITNETLGSTYTVQYTINNTCANSSTQDVTVNASDDVSFTTSDYCSGTAHTVTGIGTAGGTFTYGTPGDGSSINASTGVISNGVAGTTYNLVYTTTGACAATSAPTPVTVKTMPTVDAGTTQTVCTGTDVTLTATNPNSATITWNNSVVDGNPFTPTLGSTTYTATATLNGCVSTDIVSVVVNQNPGVNAGTDLSVCEGDEVTLTASNPNAGVLSWSGSITNGSPFTPAVGTTTYTATVTLGSCVNTDEVEVEVNVVPTTDAGMDQTVCAGDDVVLTATNPDAATITWTNSVTDGVVFNPVAGNVIYVATATLGACSSQDQVTVEAIESPIITADVTNDSGTGNGAIDATITGGTITSTTWSNSSTDEDLTGLSAGTYTITVENTNGCTSVETFTVLSTVGIVDNVSIDNNLTIYPNPSNGLFNIQLEGEFKYSVLDSRGRLIMYDSTADNAVVDLTQHEAGVYFLRIQVDGDLVVKKLVIK